MKEKCQAEYHVEGCNGFADNEHHLTPRCIAKKLGWSRRQIESVDNKIPINFNCHVAVDKSTPERKNKQVFRSLEELRRWRNRYDLVYDTRTDGTRKRSTSV